MDFRAIGRVNSLLYQCKCILLQDVIQLLDEQSGGKIGLCKNAEMIKQIQHSGQTTNQSEGAKVRSSITLVISQRCLIKQKSQVRNCYFC